MFIDFLDPGFDLCRTGIAEKGQGRKGTNSLRSLQPVESADNGFQCLIIQFLFFHMLP